MATAKSTTKVGTHTNPERIKNWKLNIFFISRICYDDDVKVIVQLCLMISSAFLLCFVMYSFNSSSAAATMAVGAQPTSKFLGQQKQYQQLLQQ